MRKLFITIYLLLVSILSIQAQTLSEQSSISLMTCTPGRPLYLHFGHAALRVQDPAFLGADSVVAPIDWTFNYGLFSFSTDHFYWKFAKGETDYQLGLQFTPYFIEDSKADGRTVYEQELRLTLNERQMIFDALVENYKPENREYRYNFVFDNCATRPMRLIEAALPTFEVSTDTIADTWRKQITYYAGKWSWGEFGINLVFGRQADQRMTVAESLFLPENLMNYMATSGLVGRNHIGKFTPRDASFWTSPYLMLIVIALLMILLGSYEIKHRKLCFTVDALLYTVYTVIGLIICFLMFASTHPLVGENANILVFNPLCILLLIACLTVKGRRLITHHGIYLTAYVLISLIFTLAIWGQTFHFLWLLPIMQTVRYACTYYIMRARNNSNKNNHAK